jgi:uncharacterized delta-60 repeat protein
MNYPKAKIYRILWLVAWLGTVSTPCAFAGVVPPKITVQPQNQSVLHGDSAIFTVTATGTQPLSYQWKYNGLPILGATSSNLVLQGVGNLLIGNYKVTVSNSAGTVTSSNATLSIDVPPSIVVPPIGLSLLAGNSGTLSVVAVGSELSYQWYWNGLPLANATNATLVLNNAQSASSGAYMVAVSNPLGSVSSSPVVVAVHVPALITVQPLSLAAILGNNFSLSTLAIGDSPLSYQWFFNNNPIAGATNAVLNMVNAQASQAGNYSVTVNNPFGTSSSAIAKVTLSIPAAIALQPVEQDVIAGGNAIFSVQGTGTPPLSYQWRLNGSPIPNATNATWVLTNVTAQMSGDVSVIVSNLVGADTSLTVPLNVTRTVRQGMVDTYNGSANNADSAQAVKVDAAGNAYVTGFAKENNQDLNYITIKYDASGHRLWRSVYNGSASKNDQADALAVDDAGNVYVTGTSEGNGTGLDFATVKYDANGNQLWVARYNSPASRDDQAKAIAVDSQGNVYVTGSSQGNNSGLDYVTIKYDTNGNQLWVSQYNGPGNEDDAAQALVLDAAGNIFVTGYSVGNGSGNDYATIKYDTNGSQLWVARYNGPANLEDDATQIAVTPDGGVCVTGQSKGAGTDFDYATVKYGPNGNQIWVRRFNGSGSRADQVKDLAVDALGNVLVTGSSTGQGGSLDYVTMKYDPQGTMLWQASYDAGDVDQANAIALDVEGNVYVTGSSKGINGGADFATVKYSGDNGDQLWVARYNGAANNDDDALAIAVDAQHRVYVAGASKGGSTDLDFTTIQYVQPEPPSITLQPSSQSVNVGGSVTLLVVATGSDPLSYQWRLNGVNIPAATNNILILTNVQTSDGGAYDVVVANDADSINSDTANLTVNGAPLALGDNFADRIVVNSLLGVGVGSNIGATRESGEPRPAGKNGGKSVWFTWRAPASGIVTITTRGSTFDTLLGVYTGTNVTSLTSIASDDDSGGFLTSSVTFNAQVGTDYQIQVDGVNGASGLVVVSWNFEITADRIPIITSLSSGQTVGVGEQVTFAVSVDLLGIGFQWYHDGVIIPGAILSSLQVTNTQPEDVGLYYVRLIALNREILSKPTYLQINRTDDTVDRSAVAVDKFSDLPILNATKTLPFKTSSKGVIKMGTTSRGYSSTQIFTTYSGTTQPGEPSNCGVPGGASAWYSYTAQRDGILYINTDGSSFDTTLGVYTGNGNDFSSLTVVACDDDSGANGKTSAVRFQAFAGTNYFISVDGKNGASGRVVLNINLGDPAAIASAPQSTITTNGQNALFAVSANGSAPFAYEWKFNGVKIASATNSSLVISNVQSTKVGQYSVTVSNLINKIAAQPASLLLASPTLSIIAQPANQTVPEGAGVQFSVSASSTSAIRYQWRYNGSDIPAATNSALSFSRVQAGQAGNYSVLLSDANGIQQSTSGSLTVSPDVVIARQPDSITVGANSNVTLSVVAYGSPAINYQWKLNGVDLPGATNANLTLANFNAANEGTYRVVVSNFTNSVTSSDALLMVGSTPRLLAPSQGKNGAFQFQAAALPNVNYNIQASTDLTQWVTISQVSSTNGYIFFSDAQASQSPARYYRLVSGP